MLLQEQTRAAPAGLQGQGRSGHSIGSYSHAPDRAHSGNARSSNSDSSSAARTSNSGQASQTDPSIVDRRSDMQQRRHGQPDYAGVSHNRSSEAVAAGEQHEPMPLLVFGVYAVSRSAATCRSGQVEQGAELLLGVQGSAEYPALAHTRSWTSWQQAAGARRAQEMWRGQRAPATGAALAAGARRTSSATSWAASTWMGSTAAPAMARVGCCSMIP